MSRPELRIADLPGRTPYRDALELQRRLARERVEAVKAGGRESAAAAGEAEPAGEAVSSGEAGSRGERAPAVEAAGDVLILVEHEPVVTLGRGADADHLAVGPGELAARGVDLVEVERGGDITYHGPGQLVGYPILDLRNYRKDLHWYLRTLESALVRALGELGLPAFRVPEHTGVWVGDGTAAGEGSGMGDRRAGDSSKAVLSGRVRKIGSIGVHASRWVTWHGFALNVTREPLEAFELIVPCGIRGVRMTSLEAEGVSVGRKRVREAVALGFAAAFDARVREWRADPATVTAGGRKA